MHETISHVEMKVTCYLVGALGGRGAGEEREAVEIIEGRLDDLQIQSLVLFFPLLYVCSVMSTSL